MIKCRTDYAIRAELQDILLDLNTLYSIAVELSFHGANLKEYKTWLLQAMGCYELAYEQSGGKKEKRIPIDQEQYCNISDLKDLTSRAIISHKRTRLAYESELDEQVAEIFNIAGLCLIMSEHYAN